MIKGIILAGGKATRLLPATQVISKQLLPVYDKPMVYYPLTTLLEAGVDELLVITNEENVDDYRHVCDLGLLPLQVVSQSQPAGIAQAITIAAAVGYLRPDDTIVLILGDNLFCGRWPRSAFAGFSLLEDGARLYASRVANPSRYGVLSFDVHGCFQEIIEKPEVPPSEFAVTGLYVYSYTAVELVKTLQPSARGELEITDLNNAYLKTRKAKVLFLDEGMHWLDMGTPDSLLEAAQLVKAIQDRTGTLVGSPEIVAYRRRLVTLDVLQELCLSSPSAYYRDYLNRFVVSSRGEIPIPD